MLADGIRNHLLHQRHQYSLSAGEKKEIISTKPSHILFFFFEAPKYGGLRCNDCGYVTRQTGNMQKHCRQKHGWQNDWTKGRNFRRNAVVPRDLPRTSGVTCQRLLDHGRASSWFEVGRETVMP
ncbi:Cutinase transcription factor 1 beta [Fusarium oxysporum f. sp. albedinis]|nr:Cutinase transcription factor 1 beta [Fusarium oxysporum f. sp. albedinis]